MATQTAAQRASGARKGRTPRVVLASDPELARRARRGLMTGTVLIALGSFMPWVHTAVGNVPGYAGAGLWTFYFSMLGFAAMLLPYLRVAAAQALIMGAIAVALPMWQLVRLSSMVGFAGWLPGFGLLMTAAGGAVCLVAARRLLASA